MSKTSLGASNPSSENKALISKFQSSFLFKQFYDECMETEKTLRGNCWTHEVLIANANQFLEKFMKSSHSSLDRFFRVYIQEKFPKKITANNFVLIFFLSIEHFAPVCYEVEALQYLFSKEFSRAIIEDWWNIRDSVMLIHNLAGNLSAPLNTFYLAKSEYIVLIERVRNNEYVKQDIEKWIQSKESEIKDLRKDVRQGKQLSKPKLEKLEKHFKIGKTCSSPICRKLLDYFVEDEEVGSNLTC